MNEAPAIEVRGLTKRIGKSLLLAPLDLTIPQGSIFLLSGHNGAGKSTLIKLLLNILKPTSGTAKVLGLPSTTLGGKVFTRIGYVSEKQEMPDWMTVQNLMDYLRPMYGQWNDSGLLEDLQLPPERKIQHLSRGMRMKLALASVLAFEPELLLMDEPFSGLDTAVRSDLIETLLDRTHTDMDSDKGTTIVIASHDLVEMESFATHVALLQNGRLIFAEPMESLLTRFREVTATFSEHIASRVIDSLPEGCIAPEASGTVLRFVDTRPHPGDHEREMLKTLSGTVRVQSDPMTLSSIFLAMNKASRRADRRDR